MWLELLLLIFAFLWIIHLKKRKGLPPSPFSIPIFGTLDTFRKFDRATEILFNEKYFDYKYFCPFFVGPSVVTILINDFKLAKELFSKDEFSGKNDEIIDRVQ